MLSLAPAFKKSCKASAVNLQYDFYGWLMRYVLYADCLGTLVAMGTKTPHRLIMEKCLWEA